LRLPRPGPPEAPSTSTNQNIQHEPTAACPACPTAPTYEPEDEWPIQHLRPAIPANAPPQPPTKKRSGDTFSISARSEPSEPEEIFDDKTEDSLFILPDDGTADMEYYEQNYSQYYYMIPICGSLDEKYPNYGATSSGEDMVKTNIRKAERN
jgi:hypothetical protein